MSVCVFVCLCVFLCAFLLICAIQLYAGTKMKYISSKIMLFTH
jgi:hypothetical protein